MAIDSASHFLFVANQGSQIDPASGTVSVFTIQSGSLTRSCRFAISCSRAFGSERPGPSAIAVTPDGKFLYVANQFEGTVSSFSVDGTSGALTPGPTVPVGTAPSGMAITPDGGFLYVANSGSSNVSGFAVCNQVVTSCSVPTSPDGTLTPVAGSPFSAGLGPSAIAVAFSGKFLFVVDRQSNQVSEYKLATGTGELTCEYAGNDFNRRYSNQHRYTRGNHDQFDDAGNYRLCVCDQLGRIHHHRLQLRLNRRRSRIGRYAGDHWRSALSSRRRVISVIALRQVNPCLGSGSYFPIAV